MSDIPFETLIKENRVSASERWYPCSVEKYKISFNIDTSIENSHALRSNLAYSMQYLEFLEKEIAELAVNSVIYTMIVKSYVITGMSILEGLFSNVIKSRGWWKMSDLESLGTTRANETTFDGNKIIVQTELLRKVEPYPVQMNLDELIKILARSGEGGDTLVRKLADMLDRGKKRVSLLLPYSAAGLVDALQREASVLRLEYSDAGIEVEAVVQPELFGRVKPYIPGYAEEKEDWDD